MAYGKPTGRIERCSVCPASHDVDARGRLPVHRKASGTIHHGGVTTVTFYGPEESCRGGGRASREESARRAVARAQELSQLALSVRDEAAVALDAFLSGRPEYEDRIPELLRLALARYHNDFVPKVGVRGHLRAPYSLWNWTKRRGWRPGEYSSRGDVYCTICGVPLIINIPKPRERFRFAVVVGASPAAAGDHLTQCGLRFLAGLCEAVEPWTKVLPLEHRQEESCVP